MNAGRKHCDAAGPIGVFDSGLGGLTVVRQILSLLPGEDIVYLGDSARVPYGTKSPATVCKFALQDAGFLLRFDPKMIVVACNTASAVAMEVLRENLPVEVIGVVEPAAAAAVRLADGGEIGVIGTEGTVNSKAYPRAIHAIDGARTVLAAAAPLLVPIVEEGREQDDPIVLAVLTGYLHELQRRRPAVLILGCTHYPLLVRAISKLMGPHTRLLDPGLAVAEHVRARLNETGLLSRQAQGSLRCFTTDNPERFAHLARRFLGREVAGVELLGADELDRAECGGQA